MISSYFSRLYTALAVAMAAPSPSLPPAPIDVGGLDPDLGDGGGAEMGDLSVHEKEVLDPLGHHGVAVQEALAEHG